MKKIVFCLLACLPVVSWSAPPPGLLNRVIPGLYDVELVIEEGEVDGEFFNLVPCPDNTDCDSRIVIQINSGGTAAQIGERDFVEVRPGGAFPDGFRHDTSMLGAWKPTIRFNTITIKLIGYRSSTLIPNEERPLDGREIRSEVSLTMEFDSSFSTVSGSLEQKLFRFDFELDGPEPEPIAIFRGTFSGARSNID